MYEFIKGNPVDITPTYAVIETSGIGYLLHISLWSYSSVHEYIKKNPNSAVNLYIHHVIREDASLWFGFFTKEEREVFRLLLTVSGVGANTARMILSSLNPDEICNAISASDAKLISSVKGIGAKTAERIIVDLKNKIGHTAVLYTDGTAASAVPVREEAVSALIGLGFNKAAVEKVVAKIVLENPECTIENLIKQGLRML